jgi:hypothetical protein
MWPKIVFENDPKWSKVLALFALTVFTTQSYNSVVYNVQNNV